jgi:hypothetical protein
LGGGEGDGGRGGGRCGEKNRIKYGDKEIQKKITYARKSEYFLRGIFLDLYFVQHCLICRPTDSTVSEDVVSHTFAFTGYIHNGDRGKSSGQTPVEYFLKNLEPRPEPKLNPRSS